MKTLLLVTQNPHKIEEIKSVFPSSYQLICLSDIDWHDEIIETGSSLEENAILKVRTVYYKSKLICFAEDSGLEIEALNGEPGVYTARYAGEEKDHKKNNQKVLDNLMHDANRSAQFRTVLAYKDHQHELLFEGIVKGKIAYEEKGNGGFGYDPIFIPDGFDQTFAELGNEIKLKISHRSRAVKKFVDYLGSK